jgi:hypothetical protein
MNYVFDLYNVFAKTAADTARQLTDINARTYEKLVKPRIFAAS